MAMYKMWWWWWWYQHNFANTQCHAKILNDHSARIKPTIERAAAKPRLAEVEMAPLPFVELLVPLAVAPLPVADMVEAPEAPVGVGELELELKALAMKPATVWFSLGLRAKTIPIPQ